MALLLISVFGAALAVSVASIPFIRKLAFKTGFLDQPGPRKIHEKPVPYGGGLAVLLGVFLPILGGVAGAYTHLTWGWPAFPESVDMHIPGVLHQAPRLLMLVAGSLVIFFLGLVDDKKKLGTGTKLLVQTLVAVGMSLAFGRLSLFWEGSIAGDIVGTVVTVLWIVGVTNAFNLIDHMDGLCAGVACIAGVGFLAVAWITQQWFIAAVLCAIIGGSLGFLVFNLPPARIFLGDAGSLFIGFLLASLTLSFTFYQETYPFYSYAVPLVVLSVPLFDTSSVVWIRIREKRSPFSADTNHFAHRLVDLGLSRRTAVLTIYGVTLLTGVSAVLLYEVSQTGALVIMAQILVIFGIISVIESRGRKAK